MQYCFFQKLELISALELNLHRHYLMHYLSILNPLFVAAYISMIFCYEKNTFQTYVNFYYHIARYFEVIHCTVLSSQ